MEARSIIVAVRRESSVVRKLIHDSRKKLNIEIKHKSAICLPAVRGYETVICNTDGP